MILKAQSTLVFKIGTSTLTHKTGKINIRLIETLATVLADIMNAGHRVILVTSGAIGVGVGKLKLKSRPRDTAGKQAAATVGQTELMFYYDKIFASYGYQAGQLLITKEDVESEKRRTNLINAFEKLFEFGAVPIVNENDAVAVEEIVYGDNDSLSAVVAKLVKADALIILTETDGLFESDPRVDPEAKRIPVVKTIDEKILSLAQGTKTSMGTGGMITKVHAAKASTEAGIDTYIINGSDPKNIYSLINGEDIGTHFCASKKGE